MKTIEFLSLLIIFSSFTLFQKTEFKIQDFEKMAKMNANDFETYILNKGFEFDGTQNFESFDVVHYKKKNVTMSKAVATDSSIMHIAFYETSSNTEYVNFKKQAELLGYKYINSDKYSSDTDNTQFHFYEKGKIKLNFYTANRKQYLGYCIGIEIREN